MKKLISVVTPCYNEEENLLDLCGQIKAIFATLPDYEYEHIIIDHASTDNSEVILRDLAAKDQNIKVILNSRNFGHIRSPVHAILQARGDAVVLMASDLQDPPELIPRLLGQWEAGFQVVKAVKDKSLESPLFFLIRKAYYDLVNSLSSIRLTKNHTGAGLYDRCIVEALRQIKDPYPYFRGLISEVGFKSADVFFTQPTRKRRLTKNNFYTLYDPAMLGITNHSKVPLRMCTWMGFTMSACCLFVAFVYFVAKLLFWNTFTLGTAPVVVGLFFFMSLQLAFLGLIGEYIGSIHTQVLGRPLVFERERINFDK